jgi:hypothetical protein
VQVLRLGRGGAERGLLQRRAESEQLAVQQPLRDARRAGGGRAVRLRLLLRLVLRLLSYQIPDGGAHVGHARHLLLRRAAPLQSLQLLLLAMQHIVQLNGNVGPAGSRKGTPGRMADG